MSPLVQDVMKRDMTVVAPDMPVAQAAQRMRDDGAVRVFVVEDGRLVGVVTARDIAVRLVAAGADPRVVDAGSVCTPEPTAVRPDDGTDQAERLLRGLTLRSLPVVDDGTLVGTVTLADLAAPHDRSPLVAGHPGPAPAPGTPTSRPQEGRR